MKNLLVILISVLFINCQSKEEKLTAQKIVDEAIMTTCNGLCDAADITFTFRDKKYRSIRKNGSYKFSRIVKNSLLDIVDEVSNEGFQRYVHDTPVKMPDSLVVNISEGVNSVHYFAQLPYGLNAPAVVKEALGEIIIKEEPYHVIGVTFKEDGGGADFDDTFVYWIHKEEYTVDYLAYSYSTNSGGVSFREAYNPRVAGGIRFVDYNNYKPKSVTTPLIELPALFEANKLSFLSKIELEDISVQ